MSGRDLQLSATLSQDIKISHDHIDLMISLKEEAIKNRSPEREEEKDREERHDPNFVAL